ncbi:hypothetical protein L6452_20003 [Arctium lappa]|uniref:Uncharacterized protein n=1 Tax=Arctium lappa TaxID=4217 RepID=A0ACB9BAP4_ARCLA|nr:hypothetical protein L6452_20003 [Arctium lappa]
MEVSMAIVMAVGIGPAAGGSNPGLALCKCFPKGNGWHPRYGKVFKSYVLRRYMVFTTGREACKMLLTGKDGMFTLKVIGNMIMSLEPTGEEQEKFRDNFKIISCSFASLPSFQGLPSIAARDRMFEMLDTIIARRRNGNDLQQDFLGSLIKKHSKEGKDDDEKLMDAQMKDNILTLLIAGHDTTIAALTQFSDKIYIIIRRNIWKSRVREKLDQVSPGLKSTTCLKIQNERLRRATILPWYSRKVAQDFEINGYTIKKGWSVNLDVVSIHHDPQVFVDPHKFDPSRFNVSLASSSHFLTLLLRDRTRYVLGSCKPVKTILIPFMYSSYVSDESFGLDLSWDSDGFKDFAEAKREWFGFPLIGEGNVFKTPRVSFYF